MVSFISPPTISLDVPLQYTTYPSASLVSYVQLTVILVVVVLTTVISVGDDDGAIKHNIFHNFITIRVPLMATVDFLVLPLLALHSIS